MNLNSQSLLLTLGFSLIIRVIAGAAHAADLILADKGVPPAPIIVFKDAPPRTRDAEVKLEHPPIKPLPDPIPLEIQFPFKLSRSLGNAK